MKINVLQFKSGMKKILLCTIFLPFAISAQTMPAYVPTNGLYGYWLFNGNANDNSGNNNNGTVSGVLPAADRFNVPNKAYSFNGTSSYISTTLTGILGNNPRAVAFWAKSNDGSSEMCAVSWGDEQSAPNAGVRYECAFNIANITGASIVGSDCAISYNTPAAINDNNWHHYVFQFGGGTLSQVQVFQDAVLLSQTVYTHSPNTTLNTSSNWPVNFGRIPYSIPHYFNGDLDEVGIWTRTLTTCEIQSLYHSSATVLNAVSSSSAICAGQTATLTVSGANTYTWNNSSNASGIIVSPTVSTNYSVNGTNTLTSCTGSASVNLVVISCAGLDEKFFNGDAIHLYPNPFSENITIKGNAEAGNLSVVICDVLGRKIQQVDITTATGEFEQLINLSDKRLTKGIYFIKIEQNGFALTRKLIKE